MKPIVISRIVSVLLFIFSLGCNSETPLRSIAQSPEMSDELLGELDDELDERFDDLPSDAPEDGPDDEQWGDPKEGCGFMVRHGLSDEKFVRSMPRFSTEVEIVEGLDSGDEVHFKVDAEAHPCGAIELHYVAEVVQDVANPEWLVDVFDEEVPMTMDSDFAFDPFVPFNMNVSQGDELHYTWYTGGWESWQDMGPEWAGDMDVVVIPAGETVSLDFVFDATLGVPVGSEVDFFLSMTLWRDVTTDQMVFDYMFGDTPWMVAVFD